MADPVLAVAGASGFIGSAVVRSAEAAGLTVRALPSFRVPATMAAMPVGDVVESWRSTHEATWEALVASLEGVDAVVEAAGLAEPRGSEGHRLRAANTLHPLVLAAAAAKAGVPRLVHVSSAAVQGRRPVLDETPDVDPLTPYGRSKAEAERLLLEPCTPVPPEVVVYRPTSVHGPGRRLTAQVARLSRLGLVPVVDDGSVPVPFAHIGNVGAAAALLATCDEAPSIALHPWEGVTAASLVRSLGGTPRLRVPASVARLTTRVARRDGVPALTAIARRAELTLVGQRQQAEALARLGFRPSVDTEAWDAMRAPEAAQLEGAAPARVLHISAVEYSARTLLRPQLSHLRQQGYDVRLACAPDDPQVGFHEDLAPFTPVAVPFTRRPEPTRVGPALLGAARAIRALRPRVVHLHSPAAALPIRLLPRWVLPRGTKLVYTAHGVPFQWERLEESRRDHLLERAERLLSRRTDMILFQSARDLEQATSRGWGPTLRYLGNGVEDFWFDVEEPDWATDTLTVLFIGRLVREKGVLDLVEAVSMLESVVLEIAGGQLASERTGVEQEIRARVEKDGLQERIRLLGHLEKHEMRTAMTRSHVVAVPTHGPEGVPRSLLEGAAAGRIGLTTPIGGCPETVAHGETGFLVPSHSPSALAAALSTVASMTPEERAAMGRRARARAESRNRETAVYQRLVDAYAWLGALPGPARPVEVVA